MRNDHILDSMTLSWWTNETRPKKKKKPIISNQFREYIYVVHTKIFLFKWKHLYRVRMDKWQYDMKNDAGLAWKILPGVWGWSEFGASTM